MKSDMPFSAGASVLLAHAVPEAFANMPSPTELSVIYKPTEQGAGGRPFICCEMAY